MRIIMLVAAIISGWAGLSFGAEKPFVVNLASEEARQQTVATLKQQAESNRLAAQTAARKYGWVERGRSADGRLFELIGLRDADVPLYYVTLNAEAAISTAANLVRNTAPYNVDGSGLIAGVWDGGAILTTHQEFTSPNRVVVRDGSSPDDHATHVGGTIGAKGFQANAQGMAPAVTLYSYDWFSDTSEAAAIAANGANQSRVYISNHSYGYLTGWDFDGTSWFWYGASLNDREADDFGKYGVLAQIWDGIAHAAPYYLPFKSAGNDRSDGPPPAGTPFTFNTNPNFTYDPAIHPYGDGHKGGYDTITDFGNAKNVMTVGAVWDAVSAGVRDPGAASMSSFSCWGPTDDGRIKPDIVANGVAVYSPVDTSDSAYDYYSGTSMSGPNAAGSALLLIDYYRDLFPGQDMRAATLKGLIIHTADDIGNAGPDYSNGWGLMNTKAAADHIRNHHEKPGAYFMVEDTLSNNGTRTYAFPWDGVNPIRATLSWTDPQGAQASGINNSTPVLVNNLDLRIISPNGVTNQPFVLDRLNPSALATTGDNNVDNVEQVYIANPSQAGTYTVQVTHKGGSLSGGSQAFSLLLSGTAGEFDPDAQIRIEGPGGFGATQTGQSIARVLTIFNNQSTSFSITNIIFPAGFSGSWTAAAISGFGSRDLPVTFAPTSSGSLSGTIQFQFAGSTAVLYQAVSGTGIVADVSFAVTEPSADLTVNNGVNAYTFSGTAGAGLTENISWTNQLNASSGSIPAATSWTISNVPLGVGDNDITVNARAGGEAANPASDLAANYGGNWSSGSNQGSGFHEWILQSTPGVSGHFIASGSANLNIGANAFGMYANSGGLAEAMRPFTRPLESGDTLGLQFENNSIDAGGSVGMALLNPDNEFLFQFFFDGGTSNYKISDESNGGRDTGIGWTDQGLNLNLELTGSATYRLTAGSTVITGSLVTRGDMTPTRLRLWNYTAGAGENGNVYFDNLSITSAAPTVAFTSVTRRITRSAASLALVPIPAQTVTVGQALSYTLTATNASPSRSFACSTSVNAANWTLNSSSGAFTYTPIAAQTGTVSFSFTVTDNTGTSAAETMQVTVLPVPPPVTRDGLGSMFYADSSGTGVAFRVWAPFAQSVGVRGSFNGWSSTITMTNEGASGNWYVEVPAARPGHEYKYRITYNGSTTDKRDPRSRRVSNSVGNSIIYDHNAFDWGGVAIPQPAVEDVVHYQMHVGTFEGGSVPQTFDDAISKLDHVASLGISSIKLMPIAEFAGDLSWGYNPADLFSVESSYGGPDAMKRFIKAAHQRGIAVFMDVVHNHYGPDDLDIWRFDGWFSGDFGGIYFYQDARTYTPWGNTRPDFGRPEVYNFIRDQIMMYVQEYRIGGFRWDSVVNIINTDEGPNQQGEFLLRDINWELSQNYPYVIRGSEDNAFDYAVNFQNQWDVGYRWALHGQVTASSDASRSMTAVRDLLDDWASHQRVVFSEAHDYIARTHGRSRLPSEIDGGDPDSIWARKRALLAAGIVMTTPGIPMIFQGQEFHETFAFHDDTPLRWSRTNTYAGIVKSYSDLIHARRNLRGVTPGLRGTGINVHHLDDSNKIIAYTRWYNGGQSDDVMVVANFSATRFTNNNYSIAFPSAGTWYRHYNSDARAYQSDFDDIGADVIEASGATPAANVNMGMYSLQIYTKTPQAVLESVATFSPNPVSGCVPVTITYNPNEGPLSGVNPPVILLGRNSWQESVEQPMSRVDDNTFTFTYNLPEGTHQLNFLFHDGQPEVSRTWDDNGGQDWMIPVADCSITSAPSIVITDPLAPSIIVSNATSAYTVSGESGMLTGDIYWTNLLTGAGGSFASASNWSIASIALGTGTNTIVVTGTGMSLGGLIASDGAASSAYGDGWSTGDNGGSGFGPWTLTSSGANAGNFIVNAEPNLDIGAPAFALWANSSNLSEAVRSFAQPLQIGHTFRLTFENNWVSSSGPSVGFNLRNNAGEDLFSFYFNGGAANYSISDGGGVRDSGIGYTGSGLPVAFTLTGATSYEAVIGSTTISGTLIAAADQAIAQSRVWNYASGAGSDYNVYFNFLSITNGSGQSAPVSDSVDIVRLGLLPPVFSSASSGTALTTVATSFVVRASGDPAPVLSLASGTASPGSYTFNEADGVLTYTPPYADAGSHLFEFIASNSVGVTTQAFEVSVSLTAPLAPGDVWVSFTNATWLTAAWTNAGGASSYLLDVHTSDAFSDEIAGASGIEYFASLGIESRTYREYTWSNQGVTWQAFNARNDQIIEGSAIGLRDRSGSYIISGAITGGVHEISLLARRSRGSGTYSVFVNDLQVATNIPLNSSVTRTTISGIGVQGTFTIMVTNSGGARATFDSLSWTNLPSAGGVFVEGYSNLLVSAESMTVTGLTASSTYHLRVQAVNDAGDSGFSDATSVTTLEENIPGGGDGNANGLPDEWESQHFGNGYIITDNSDADGDGVPDRQEYVAGTNPTNAFDRLALDHSGSGPMDNGGGLVIRWSSASNRFYSVVYKTNLLESFLPLTSGIAGTPPVNVYTSEQDTGSSPAYYRIGVSLEP